MLLSCIFLIILLLPVCDGVQCFNKASFHLTLSPRTFGLIEKILEYQDTGQRSFCAALLQLDHHAQGLTLKLDQSKLRTDPLNTPYLQTYDVSIFSFPKPEQADGKVSIDSEITFICSDADGCDRPLIFKYLKMLLSIDHHELVDALQPLFPSHSNKTRKCSVGEKLIPKMCDGTACIWRYWETSGTVEGECRHDEFEHQALLILQTEVRAATLVPLNANYEVADEPTGEFYTERGIDFWCHLDNCNNEKAGEQLREAVYNHYKFWSQAEEPADISDSFTTVTLEDNFYRSTTVQTETSAAFGAETSETTAKSTTVTTTTRSSSTSTESETSMMKTVSTIPVKTTKEDNGALKTNFCPFVLGIFILLSLFPDLEFRSDRL